MGMGTLPSSNVFGMADPPASYMAPGNTTCVRFDVYGEPGPFTTPMVGAVNAEQSHP